MTTWHCTTHNSPWQPPNDACNAAPAALNCEMHKSEPAETWPFCGAHEYPLGGHDMGGDPYCWAGHWFNETEKCQTYPRKTVTLTWP